MSAVAAEWALLPGVPSRAAGFMRRQCECGCGRWWYHPRRKGQPPKYATPECYLKVRRARRAP